MKNLKMSFNLFKRSIFLIALCFISSNALAEKIGYVDARRLIDESPQGIQQLEKIEQEFGEREKEIKAKIDKYKLQEADLIKNSVLMPAAEAEQKQAALQELQRELKRNQRDFNEEYAARRNQVLAGLQKIISDAVIFIAERDQYDLIVQQAVYASAKISLTEVVLEELTKRMQSANN